MSLLRGTQCLKITMYSDKGPERNEYTCALRVELMYFEDAHSQTVKVFYLNINPYIVFFGWSMVGTLIDSALI